MARKKKKKRGTAAEDEAPAAAPKAPKNISRPFAAALKGMKAAPAKRGAAAKGSSGPAASPKKKKSSPRESRPEPQRASSTSAREPAAEAPYSPEDRVAFNNAFSNVAPLGSTQRGKADRVGARAPRRVARAPRVDFDAVARAKLAALVSEGLSFEVRRDEGWVEGRRSDAPKSALRDLRDGRAAADAELDLHGMTGDEAARALVRFLRHERDRGRLVVRVIHGKGLHSTGGVGVLGDRVVTAITKGPGAPLVHAFITAALASGGSGALLVRLGTR